MPHVRWRYAPGRKLKQKVGEGELRKGSVSRVVSEEGLMEKVVFDEAQKEMIEGVVWISAGRAGLQVQRH